MISRVTRDSVQLCLVVRVLDHEVDTLAWVEDLLLFWNLTVVVDFHSSVDLDSGLADWRWGTGLQLLVILESFVESSLLGTHSSLRSSDWRALWLGSTHVRVVLLSSWRGEVRTGSSMVVDIWVGLLHLKGLLDWSIVHVVVRRWSLRVSVVIL